MAHVLQLYCIRFQLLQAEAVQLYSSMDLCGWISTVAQLHISTGTLLLTQQPLLTMLK